MSDFSTAIGEDIASALFSLAHKLAFFNVLRDIESLADDDWDLSFPWQIARFEFRPFANIQWDRSWAFSHGWRIWWREDYIDVERGFPDGHHQYFDRPNGQRIANRRMKRFSAP